MTTAAKTIGVNPKINNMNQGYKAAKYDLLWICDSNIKGKLVCPNHATADDSAPLTNICILINWDAMMLAFYVMMTLLISHVAFGLTYHIPHLLC